ncbi:MAG TPA: hypothetical protein VM450_09225 [Thermomicrobiales bacterium]|nr:hypothetical protein [Thermomicrobiales bacterium]
MTMRTRLLGAALSLSLLASAGGVFAAQDDTYTAIAEDTASIRQLELLEPLDIEFQDRDELRAWILDEITSSYPEADQAADLRVMVILGFVDPGTDLGQMQIDILGEQIAGYYDPETKQMVVVRSNDGEELSASDEITFAHETIHALQDQHYDLMSLHGDLDAVTDDQGLALDALTEGDATVGQIEYLISNPGLLAPLQAELGALDSSALDASPPVYQKTLLFPYNEGADFVDALHKEGGWEAVDAAYGNLPQSTEQILHPEKYLAGEAPIEVTLNDPLPALGQGWQVFDVNTMGEYITALFLESHDIDGDAARQAAEGWGGDAYTVVGTDDEDETALVWKSAWDTEEDAREFFSVLTRHELARFDTSPSANEDGAVRFEGDGVVGEIHREGSEVFYVLAPNASTLDTIAQSQEGPGTILTQPVATPDAGSN